MKLAKLKGGGSNRVGFSEIKKVLVLGQGNIGSHVTRKLKPSVDVLTFDVAENSMDELPWFNETSRSYQSLHVPLIESTKKGFIDAQKLGWMKDGAALVNTARGPVVDEDALFKEIQSKKGSSCF